MENNIFCFEIGDRLRHFRKLRKLTVSTVSKRLLDYNLIYSNYMIYKWETEVVRPDLETVFALCEIYGTTIHTLLDDDASYDLLDKDEKDILILEQDKEQENW